MGIGGVGNAAVGAPNLTDRVWLHGYGQDAIVCDHQHTASPTRCRRSRAA